MLPLFEGASFSPTKIKYYYYVTGAEPINLAGGEPEIISTTDQVQAISVEDDTTEGEEKKKKKKKNKSKGKGPSKQQSNPPTIPIAELFPDGMIIFNHFIIEQELTLNTFTVPHIKAKINPISPLEFFVK